MMTYTLYFVSKLETTDGDEYSFVAISDSIVWRISVLVTKDNKLNIHVSKADSFVLFEDSIVLYERLSLNEAITIATSYVKNDVANKQQ